MEVSECGLVLGGYCGACVYEWIWTVWKWNSMNGCGRKWLDMNGYELYTLS
jgi:hypothetical protein